MRLRLTLRLTSVLLALTAFAASPLTFAADAATNRPAARTSPDWLRDGIIYEVFPRAFSASGDF